MIMRMIAAGLLVLGMGASTAWASSAPKDSGPPSTDTLSFQRLTLQPPPIIMDRIPGFKVVMSLALFPGVPERAACRFIVRTVNDSPHRISTQYLVRTYNSEDSVLHVWMIPSGDLKPGEVSERLYSCKRAKGMVLDQNNASAWPRGCVIDGEERSPCPVTLNLETNLPQLDPAKMAQPAAAGAKPAH